MLGQSPSKYGHEWFDKLSAEAESEDIHCEESDTTSGQSSVRPVRLLEQNIFGLSDSYEEYLRSPIHRTASAGSLSNHSWRFSDRLFTGLCTKKFPKFEGIRRGLLWCLRSAA